MKPVIPAWITILNEQLLIVVTAAVLFKQYHSSKCVTADAPAPAPAMSVPLSKRKLKNPLLLGIHSLRGTSVACCLGAGSGH